MKKRGEKLDIKTKFELDVTPVRLREIITELSSGKHIYHSEMEDNFKYLNSEMDKLRNEFRENTSQDKQLAKHFENDNPKDRYQSIVVAGAILGEIDVRNLQRENNKLDGEKEEYPYNKEQLKMINAYKRFENTIQKAEQYLELNYEQEDCIEM